MRKKMTLAMIGHFGGNKEYTDGQTIKTVNLYRELKQATDWNIRIVDTWYRKKNPIYLFFRTVFELVRTRDIIVLLSVNGLKFYLPLLYYAARILGTRVYHDVIGGNLAGYIDRNPKYVKYLNAFRVNYTETEMLQEELKKRGVRNTQILPNFRRIPIVKESDLKSDYREPYAFCTFSRVIQEKGIEDAISAIEEVNAEAGRQFCRLDIYGPVGRNYQQRFAHIMSNVTEAVRYRGKVPSEKAAETIKDYYALLFPSHWRSESQAGSISESFSAGVPVLATDWRCNHEMIKSGYNGLIYPGEQAQTLKDAIEWVISQKGTILEIKKNCRKSAFYYQPDKYIQTMIAFIEKQR